MPDWALCPTCALKHSRRADGLCPRCKIPLDRTASPPEPPAPPGVHDDSAPPRRHVATAQAARWLVVVGGAAVVALSFSKGQAFLAARMMMWHELESKPARVVDGKSVRYRLTAPNDRWYSRTEAAARKDNPLADRWLVRPDRDANIVVIAETLPARSSVEMDRLVKAVVENMKKGSKGFTVRSESPLETSLEGGRLVRARSITEGQEVEWDIALYIQHPYVFQILAFSGASGFSEVEPDLERFIASFELP